MVGTLRLVGPSVRQLLHQLNPTQKLNENRQPSEGRYGPQRVADFELSSAKERPKFLPIVLFRSLRRIFYHNLFSHQCLEQNEASFKPPNFGFWDKVRRSEAGCRRSSEGSSTTARCR